MTQSLYKRPHRFKEATKEQKSNSNRQRVKNSIRKRFGELMIVCRLRKEQNRRDHEFIELMKKINIETFNKAKEEIKKKNTKKLKLLRKELEKRV